MEIRSIRTDAMLYHHSVDVRRTASYDLHCHHYYEVFYLIAGRVGYLVEGRRFAPEPGSFLLIPPNVFHGVRVESDDAYERLALHFAPELLHPESRSALLAPFHAASGSKAFCFADARELRPFLDQLLDAGGMDETLRGLSLRIRLEALLSQIARMAPAPAGAPAAAPGLAERLIDHVNAHVTEPLSLDELSASFYVSKHHLNKVFRKAAGTTVGNYVLRKRVALAQRLLRDGRSAASAAADAGFRDYSSFYRAFKNVCGCAPSACVPPFGRRGLSGAALDQAADQQQERKDERDEQDVRREDDGIPVQHVRNVGVENEREGDHQHAAGERQRPVIAEPQHLREARDPAPAGLRA
ncbi:AraC-type DNA-binding protein [Paenibacillus sp. UNC496MF]|uniref:helix-turn-helix transcriptional regulator n=1 Tax=Paenibacillus sp. UNC496MF TaxID=1502753 RepID=UPI0008DF0DFD|nr:AraC family transcriptional regulator [Paenibacillus sp. UNC496MF]SFJ04122.1 AraC-type DNA-binding protein [Paenibacillus sp. UNC496MF]